MSALRLINETEITGAVSFVNVQDVFSADFDIYKITYAGGTPSTTTSVDLRFINSSGSVIASDYDYARLSMTSHIAFAEIRSTTGTFVDDFFSGNSYNDGQSVGWVFNPYSSSSYTFALYQNMSASSTPYTWGQKGIAVLHQSTSCTGFQFLPSGATFSTGFIRTYGLRVDNG